METLQVEVVDVQTAKDIITKMLNTSLDAGSAEPRCVHRPLVCLSAESSHLLIHPPALPPIHSATYLPAWPPPVGPALSPKT
jgi:hypothetical protein